MKTSWTAGLKPEQITEIRKDYVGSVILRKRLTELLEDKIRVATNKQLSESAYNSPNWAYQQADLIGYQRAISEIISLIEDNHVEK